MPATRNHSRIGAARAAALFVSALQPSEQPSARQVGQAIATTLRRFGDRGAIRLGILENNIHAQPFWTALGYQEIDRQPDLAKGRPALVMRKDLRSRAPGTAPARRPRNR